MKNFLLPALILVAVITSANAQLQFSEDSVPVRVSYFSVTQTNNRINLNWKVVCFLQYANFQVERSTNGSDYTTLNTFTADRLRCQSPFDFQDVQPTARIFYRLKVGDKDGNFSTSKVVVAFGKEKSFEINSVTPNLVNSKALLSISSPKTDKLNISVINYDGVVIKRILTTISTGVTDISVDFNDFSKGLYILSVTNSSLDVRTARVAKL